MDLSVVENPHHDANYSDPFMFSSNTKHDLILLPCLRRGHENVEPTAWDVTP